MCSELSEPVRVLVCCVCVGDLKLGAFTLFFYVPTKKPGVLCSVPHTLINFYFMYIVSLFCNDT